jgi:crotonobetainyl-CoA:carnitine CoA-transferase CaiB-like acyl-CoA transferase
MPELREGPRFAALPDRSQNRYVLAEIVQEWIEKHFQTRDEAINFFRAAGLIAAPVLTVAEAVNHPQFKSRGVMDTIEVLDFGPVALPKAPFHMSKTPSRIPPRVALLGEDNREILGKCLGYTDDTVAALQESGVLGQDPALARRG